MKTEMISDGHDIFVVVDGVKIAKRGRPGARHAKTWIPLEPGWTVQDKDYPEAIEVSFDPKATRAQQAKAISKRRFARRRYRS
jgi:hypothetical protein